jgi:hypothetical protein
VAELAAMWDELAEAAAEPGGWSDFHDHHLRFFRLQARQPGDDDMRDAFELSWRLMLTNDEELREDEEDFDPYDGRHAAIAARRIREFAQAEADRLRALWPTLPDDSPARAARAEADAFEPRPEDAPLLRYEAQLSRQFHRALADLVKLTKTGDDLVEAVAPTEANSEAEVVETSCVESESSDAEPTPESVSAEAEEAEPVDAKPDRRRQGRSRGAEGHAEGSGVASTPRSNR